MTTNYNFSIWEKESFVHYHHAIIGGGIVGLHTAIALKNKFPTHSVILLEKGLLPTGASTKNAGFACMGSATELLDDLSKSSPNEVLALFEMRRKGLADTRQLLGDNAIGYQANGSYELLNENDVHAIGKIEALNTFLSPLIQENAFTINNNLINSYGNRFLLIITDSYNPLPVSITYFEGERKLDFNQLTWNATQEKNIAYYQVQRSLNGNDFNDIGIVKAKNSSTTQLYLFKDENAIRKEEN